MQVLEKDGRPAFVVLPIEEWHALEARLETLEDVKEATAIRQAIDNGQEETVPSELLDRLLDGESPVKVWREYRGVSQATLAKQSGVSAAYLSQIEAGKKSGSVDTLKKIAVALSVDLDDLT
jgi:DNA-binding XRE family transcriptional regulator